MASSFPHNPQISTLATFLLFYIMEQNKNTPGPDGKRGVSHFPEYLALGSLLFPDGSSA
jgi:hypothetical protein